MIEKLKNYILNKYFRILLSSNSDSDQLLEREHVEDLLDKKPDIIWVSLGFQNKKDSLIFLEKHTT